VSVHYLKVCRDVRGSFQVGFMPSNGTEVYLYEPLDDPDPDPDQAHYTYDTQELARTDGWVLILEPRRAIA
jgi:hypothetical protein